MQTNISTTQKATGTTSYAWRVVALLWVVALLNYMDRQMLSTMKPSMMVDISELQSATNFGYLMAIFLWVYGIMSPVAGMIADRINRKWLIVASLFVWSAVTFGMGYATSFRQLYWLRAAMGVSEALYIPAALSLIADYHSSRTRSLAIGIHMTGLYMGQALGGFGATIAGAFSWQTAFCFLGGVGIVYALVLIVTLKEKENMRMPSGQQQTNNSSVSGSLRFLFASIPFWIILFYFAIPSLPGWGVKNWLPTLFSDTLHIDMAQAGPYATITIAVSQFLGVIAGGFISDRWVEKNSKGRVYTSAAGIALTVPALLFIGFGHSLWHIVAAAFCFGFGFGMFDANNMPILCQFVPARYRATAYGLMNMAGVFAGALVTDLLGRSTDAGNLGQSFAWLSVIVLAALVVQVVFLKPRTKDCTDTVPAHR